MAQANLRSLFDYLNEPMKNPDGTFMKTKEEKTKDGKTEKEEKIVIVSDILATLNPYPVSPFPTTHERLPMLEMILGKKLRPGDEAYVDTRIREAATFCRLPDQWGVEPLQKTQDDDKFKTSGDVKRIKTNLDGEEMDEVWKMAGDAVLQEYSLFNKAVKDDDTGYDSEDPDADRVQEIRKQLGMDTESTEESEEQEKQAQPIEQAPLPFETMLKFATTGVFEVPT
jgi:hypothetical protein